MEENYQEDLLSYLETFISSSHLKMRAYFKCGGIGVDLAEDLCSEVTMMALLKIENQTLRLEEYTIDDFTRYMWGIARNIKKKCFQKISKEKLVSIDVDEAKELEANKEIDLEYQSALKKFPDKLLKEINKLSGQQKSVAYLSLIPQENGELLARSDISHILGMQPTTVTKNLQRAKKKLRDSLKSFQPTFKEIYNG
jgi:RNA polymerase sigma factor (sigma-70 family)